MIREEEADRKKGVIRKMETDGKKRTGCLHKTDGRVTMVRKTMVSRGMRTEKSALKRGIPKVHLQKRNPKELSFVQNRSGHQLRLREFMFRPMLRGWRI